MKKYNNDLIKLKICTESKIKINRHGVVTREYQ